MRTIQVPKRAIARLLVVAGVAAVFATSVVAANAAESSNGGAAHTAVRSNVRAVPPGSRCASWCTLRNYAAPWQCLDADTTNINSNGDKVQLWGCSGGWNQQWRASEAADELGGRLLINRASGRCLDADSWAIHYNGDKVQLWDCGGTEAYNQHWRYYTTHGSWTGQFVNMASSTCLDADSRYLGNGGEVQIWSCSGGYNQSWNLNDV
jgi:hypothetical protein